MTRDQAGQATQSRRWVDTLAARVTRLWETPERLLIILAAVIGAVTGLGAIGFSALIELARTFFFGQIGTALHERGLYAWLLPLLPMSGALAVGLITYFFAPEAEGHGVPEVMDAMARKGGRIRPRVAGAKAVASALTIGSGGSAGTEGPIIQIGAAIGSGVGQWLGLGLSELRVLIGCGAAAGIAAIFHAPIAGVLFAVEVLLRDVSLRSFVPIIISAVASSTVTQAMRGHNEPIFPVPLEFMSNEPVYSFSVIEVANYAALGIVCGLVAWSFVKALYLSEDLFRKLPLHRILRPVLGAALLGLVALGSEQVTQGARPAVARYAHEMTVGATPQRVLQPAVMGNGYPTISLTLEPLAYRANQPTGASTWTVTILLVLLAAKILATCLTLGSGGSGGVFAPSLFMGATTGGAFGVLVQATGWFPDISPGGYALVGMAAVVAASIHAPLTAGIMLFELTRDYKVVVPIMLAGVIALAVARRLEPASIYTLKLLRRGVDIYRGQDISLLKHLQVREVMRDKVVTVAPGAGVTQVIAKFVEHPGNTVFVVDDDQRLLGIITAHQSRSVMANAPSFEGLLIAQDLMQETRYPVVPPSDTLADVMRRLSQYRGEVAVVLNGRLVGAIWPEDVIERYNAEVFKRDMASSMAAAVTESASITPLPAVDNTSIAEIPVPRRFVGHSVGSLDVRNRYGVTILMIKQSSGAGKQEVNAVPTAEYTFQPNDRLLVMGPDERLRRLGRGDASLA